MHDTAGLGSAVVTRLCRGLNGDIYGSAYGGSYYRRSGGIWTKLNSPQGISIGFTPAISVDGSGTFFAAVNKGFSSMGGGVYATKDNGGHWLKVGLDSLMISQMESFGDSTFVLTINRGVNIINSNNLTGVQSSFQRPLAFVLSQNYPNPFNPTTTIRFELPKSLHVSLKVYDILGQEVSVLVNENRSAGVYEMRFDGTNLASGVYFYRLTAGAFVETRKLLLLR